MYVLMVAIRNKRFIVTLLLRNSVDILKFLIKKRVLSISNVKKFLIRLKQVCNNFVVILHSIRNKKRKKMKKCIILIAMLLVSGISLYAQSTADEVKTMVQPTRLVQKEYTTRASWKALKGEITLYMANDLGRNGYYDQKPIAELMGEMAGTVDPKCVIAAGDIHHFNGIASLQDPLWMTNYEQIYSHPDLMLDWFPICGNHEYRGNTTAFMNYGTVSRRWMMPSKYYTRVFSHGTTTVRVVMIDTTPLLDKYRNDPETYPDACKEDMQAQLSWLDSTLKNAHEDWVIVIGHHPVYAETNKSEDERLDMQKRVMPILHKYNNVDIYACGHIHNFQHIRKKGDKIDYVVNSSASLSRPVKPIDGTVFCSPADGFSIITADKQLLCMTMIDKEGNAIHEIKRTK